MATTAFTKKTLSTETVEPALTPSPANKTQTNFAKKVQTRREQIEKAGHSGGTLDEVPQMRVDGF